MNESTKRHYSSAERKAQAVREIEDLIKKGTKPKAALQEVAYLTGLGERTLYTFLQKTKGIALDEREAALARKRPTPRPKESCHPDALEKSVELYRGGMGVCAIYRQIKAESTEQGWSPIPSERTLRRKLEEKVSQSERWMARRAPNSEIGGAANV